MEYEKNDSQWGRLVIRRIALLAAAFKRIEYTLAGMEGTGITLKEVGELMETYTGAMESSVPLSFAEKQKIWWALRRKHIELKYISKVQNKEGQILFYLSLRQKKNGAATAETVRKILEKKCGIALMVMEESRYVIGKDYDLVCLKERPLFTCKTAIRTMSCIADDKSGDSYYVGDVSDGRKLLMLADGMGNGSFAARESQNLLDALEELLTAGLEHELSLRLVNAFFAERFRGESFSTLDMLLIDLYTGYGQLYKYGAATTFVRRGEWFEQIKSTTLPVGVVANIGCEQCGKKFYDQDQIVMVSDGVLESIIFENKDDYILEILQACGDASPGEVADYLMHEIQNQSGNRLRDDATIIVCKLVKSL